MIRIDIETTIIVYKEGDVYIVYSPELDLSGYDTTLKKAHESFKIVLEEYFKYSIENGTLFDDLKKQGWNISKDKLRPPAKQKINQRIKSLPALHNRIQQVYQVNLA